VRVERQRARKLVSAAEAVRGFPFAGLELPDGNGRAVLSREALADHLRGCEAGQLEAFEQALELAVEWAEVAFRAQEGWVDGVRAGLVALLEFFDEEPLLARYLVVGSAQAGPAVHARRCEVLERVAMLLDDERAPARAYPPPLTAHAVASGVLGVLHVQLSQAVPGALIELAGPLMSFTVLPFLGRRAARRELRRPREVPTQVVSATVDLLQASGRSLNHHREIAVLKVLAGEPGLNNADVALRAGVKDPAHISRLLKRLARLGLIENTGSPGRAAGAKAWRLTTAGEQLEAAIAREVSAPGFGTVLDLPEEFAGRLDYWAICVLRAVSEQPWLTSRELAARAGVGDPARVAGLLARLAALGLVASAREAHGRGAPKVWRVTDSGRQLDRAIGRAAPAPPRSMARDLMWESGGRLSEDAVSVLRVSAAEPGLSNGEIALRVGIGDANSMSQLLARLTRRGLIENARAGGRQNVWRLTASGEALENAIRQEPLAPVERCVALDLLKDQGGRLNHRVVSVLRLIAAEPGLSNLEIAQRVGVRSKGHASGILARLARFGLIENQVLDPATFEANAWRLTRSGQELDAAISSDCRPTARRGSRPALGTTNKHGRSDRMAACASC
jgi:DNA-binding MarR family transcriptional regulator